MKEQTVDHVVGIWCLLMIAFGLNGYVQKQNTSTLITVNQAGIVKIDGKTVQPDSIHEQHYNYKGQLFEPCVKYYSIKNK